MKIDSSNITFQSRHSKLEVYHKQENLQFWTGNAPGSESDNPSGVTIDISQKGLELQSQLSSSKSIGLGEDVACSEDEQKLLLLEIMLSRLLGKKFKFSRLKKIEMNDSMQANQGSIPSAGWGLIYDSKTTHYESEKLFFSSVGIVKTSDGKEIAIDLQLSISREFLSNEEIHIRAGDALRKDPLVINFNAPSAMLKNTKFSFDIDCDGNPDLISQLCAGSGFLCLDKNNDGKINDGSELFGSQSGDGFADLKLYDSDGNGWIDENDEIFDKLRIWTKDEYGNDILFALGKAGIGAIYLGNAATLFSLKGNGNRENGVIQKTGIFLKEDGTAGTIQHVDLTV